MNADVMRRIDRLAGVPLCFAATLLRGLRHLVAPRRDRRPERTLFILLSEMGSAIIADRAMRRARDELNSELYFVAFKSTAGTLRLLNTVPADHVFTIRDDRLGALLADALRFPAWARRMKIDAAVDLELFARASMLLSWLSGAVRRAGFDAFHQEGLYRGRLLTHRVMYSPHQHVAKNYLALVKALEEKPGTQRPFTKRVVSDDEIRPVKRPVTEAEREGVLNKIRAATPGFDPARHRLVLFNANCSDLVPQRNWMPDRFAETARRVVESFPDVFILCTGAPAEREGVDFVPREVASPRCINFAGAVDFEELPVLYSLSELMLTNDSGPAHFASITDMPVYVLFGPETPNLYGPLGKGEVFYSGLACSPCLSAYNHRKSPCRDNVCLKALTVDRVFARLREALDAGPRSGKSS
ncbi:glycosyltransferase family 9 protein [Kiritimatiella glycovorans]|uniref:ADP-heptose--LPS heptosyltransferase 2 n=1 Tax=Kiritimatiella glycovorans TaxID=1307763 RepID=A0A0G3EI03_9BACT|nr:glycosyltransferase family 9 protein [Kiritimatiella glycovorans]AKJ65062.1 ADP-heptose--LPS heptosyltransferase 2 [Kiritimatiella glycovorans]